MPSARFRNCSLPWVLVVLGAAACSGDVTGGFAALSPRGGRSAVAGSVASPRSGAGGAAAGGRAGAGTGGRASGAAGGAPRAGAPGSAGTGGASGATAAPDAGPRLPEAGSSAPTEVSFSPNVRVNDDDGSDDQMEVAITVAPDRTLLAGWIDYRSGGRCGFSASHDGGATWEKNITVPSRGRGIAGDTTVGTDAQGVLYYGCMDYGTGNIMLATSMDSGRTVSEFRDVQRAPDKPWVAGGRGDMVFMTWLGDPGGFKRSLDRGASWEPTISLGNINHGTAIAVGTDGTLHVPYNRADRELMYRRSKDWGATLEPAKRISEMGSFCFGCEPRHHPIVGAATDPTGKVVAITWASTMQGGDGDDDVWVLISTDGGDSWSERLRVNDNERRARAFQSWVAVDASGRVHAVWTDLRNDGDNAVYYASCSDPKTGFGRNIEVTDERGKPTEFLGDYKGIAIDGEDVVVVWTDNRNRGSDIYFSRAVGAARR